MSRAAPLLVAAGVSKRFGNTQALRDVSVSFLAGEVHALIGENGAGKSTLGKVIAGLHAQDAGHVSVAGRALRPGSIEDAFAAGVRIVHQELAQCPGLTVAENLSLHELPTRWGVVDRPRMIERAARLVHRLDPGIDVRAPLGSLPPGRRQIVQIAGSLNDQPDGRRAHGSAARVIVLDEPTSSLSMVETLRLLEIVRELRRDGLTVVYVSHRLAEVFAVCDRVSVLRDGRLVGTSRVAEIDEARLIELMIGRPIGPAAPRAAAGAPGAARGETGAALEARGVSSPRGLHDVTLSVRAGEIVGLGGLVGCGRSELLDAIFGLDRRMRGEIRCGGRTIMRRHPRAARRAGIGYVPEDRRRQGLFFQIGVGLNVLMPALSRLAAVGLRRFSAERACVAQKLAEFQIKTAGPSSAPGELSGGNQQKALLARWMDAGVRVLLLDEPTRGIDVGTKWEIHRQIRAAADGGAAVLLVSSEMPELLALSDRVLVMRGGRVAGELAGERMTQENILRLATG
ncbi:MAG: sugar ABC transporter ATP-binding protein [Phycisphaerae bacterium]|nr:sugar ABC transporter ATP-binding protein [Phycisphaerae bacterium]MCZ2400358.1 sugar ABC transporter ATP-binding protein [Phycisphaerae bacterium]